MFEYLKENPVLATILAVCLFVIVVVLVLLVVKGSKAKVCTTLRSEKSDVATKAASTKNDEFEYQEAKKEKQGAISAENLEKEQFGTLAKKNEETNSQESLTPASADEAENTANKKAGEEEKALSSSKKSKKKKNKNKSKEGSMYLEDLKNAPIEDENDFYDEEDEADRIAKYSGKWIICRVVTANSKSADVMNAGENEEEMFFFELRASNGEKLLTSEEYTTYNGALNGIETHKTNIARDNFKITLSKKGDYIFKLLSGKNMLLCMGEHYATKARCESAIESTKRFAKTAIVDENVQDIVITPPDEDEAEPPDFPDNGYNGKWIVRAHTAEDGEQVFYFELFASNGEKLLSSEEYTTYIGAINGIGTHKSNIERGNFRISLTKRGDYIYKLLNGNGQLLCLGEHYKTKRRCENAVESVKRFAHNAPILSDPETVTKNI